MSIEVYNTPFKKKQPFEAHLSGKVGMYVCGVTVYDMCHIGHARSLIVFDVIARYLRHKGYALTYVRNFTDVDDKIIARSHENGVAPSELAARYIEEFATDMQTLKVLSADIEPKATEHIPQIVDMAARLIDKGYAYESGGHVYYSVSRFRPYGKLSGRKLEDMLAGARVDVDENKRDPLDFALWKRSKAGEPAWDSPWSPGRPGWHIECSAMSTHYLGPTLDIHGGGRDLIFPHHENEIAQSEGAYDQEFVRYWVHNGFVTIAGDKMSKSLGNFLTIRELTRDVHPEVLRLLLLSRHYRSPIDFSHEAVHTARSALVRFYEMRERIAQTRKSGAARLEGILAAFSTECEAAMLDDFNTARVVAALHELTTGVNRLLDADPLISEGDNASLEASLGEVSAIMGILEEAPEVFLTRARTSGLAATGLSPAEIEEFIAERTESRASRNFARADEILDHLIARGIQLKDTPDGTLWERS